MYEVIPKHLPMEPAPLSSLYMIYINIGKYYCAWLM